MTKERLFYLIHLVDRLNHEVDVAASISHEKFDDSIHITFFYVGEVVSHVFYVNTHTESTWEATHGDINLVKAEAFMRALLHSAQYNPSMRAEP